MVSNILITEKKRKTRQAYHVYRGFWDKVTDFTDELVVQCDVSAVKSTSLVGGNNDNRK